MLHHISTPAAGLPRRRISKLYLHGSGFVSNVRRGRENYHASDVELADPPHILQLARAQACRALLCLQTETNASSSPLPAPTQLHMKKLPCPCLAVEATDFDVDCMVPCSRVSRNPDRQRQTSACELLNDESNKLARSMRELRARL